MTLQQLLEKLMNTDITPFLHYLKLGVVTYLISYAIGILFVLVVMVILIKRLFR